MIDIHVHILPGVDDGPTNIQESLVLAQVLVQEGVRAVIATPHSNDEYPRYSAAEINMRVNEFQQTLDHNSIPLRVFTGHEVLIRPGLVEDIQTGRVATLNRSRYLLLELWNTIWLSETEHVIFELLSSGIVPIIAHPERYSTIQKDPNRLSSLIQQGTLAQLTASSLLGIHGSTVQRTAETLLKRGLIQCTASDSHGMHRRPPYVVRSLHYIEKLVGQEQLQRMTELWPTAIIQNEWVASDVKQSAPTGISGKKHFFHFLALKGR